MHFQRLLLLFVASNSGKWCWDWTLPRIRAQIELSNTFVLWLQNEYEWQFCEEFAPHPGGTNDNDAHAWPNYIIVQNKIIAKCCPWINLQLWNFCHSFLQWMGSFFLIIMQYMFIQIGWQTWASLSFVPPGWGANSSHSCHSCSFSGHKQGAGPTVLSELRHKVVYNPNTFFLNWKQRTAKKADEDALQYMKIYEAAAKLPRDILKNVQEQVVRRQSKVWSSL